MGLVLDIADAVAAEINTGGILPGVTAERRVLPAFELEQLTELKVTVVPRGVQITGSTRSTSQYDVTVDIGVQQKLGPGDEEAQVGELADLVDQIADYLRQRPLADAPNVSWVSTANDPVYAPQHLMEKRVFTSVLSVTYRTIR